MLLAALGGGRATLACTGTACMEIWSTADGSGAITVYWDYTKLVQTAQRLCGASDCLYTSADPGFMAPPTDPPPAPGLYRLADGTNVGIQIVSIDAGLSMNNINGAKLSQPGDAQLLGTMPSIHVHPTWQIFVPPTEFGNYVVRYKLTTNSPGYTDSQVYTQTVTNVQPSDPTPTVTPTVAPTSRCTGDCDGNGVVTVDELLTCVSLALSGDASPCGACDSSRDGMVTVERERYRRRIDVDVAAVHVEHRDGVARRIYDCAEINCHRTHRRGVPYGSPGLKRAAVACWASRRRRASGA